MTKMATCFSTSPTLFKKKSAISSDRKNERYVSLSLMFDVFAQSTATLGTFSFSLYLGGDVVAENGARPDWFSIANPNVGAKPEDENMWDTSM